MEMNREEVVSEICSIINAALLLCNPTSEEVNTSVKQIGKPWLTRGTMPIAYHNLGTTSKSNCIIFWQEWVDWEGTDHSKMFNYITNEDGFRLCFNPTAYIWPSLFGINDQKAQRSFLYSTRHLYRHLLARFLNEYDQSQPRHSKSSSCLWTQACQYALTEHSSCIRQHIMCCLRHILS